MLQCGGIDPRKFWSHTAGTIWQLQRPDVCTTWMLENSAAAWRKLPQDGLSWASRRHGTFKTLHQNSLQYNKSKRPCKLRYYMIVYDNLGIHAVLHSFSKLFRWHPSNVYVFFSPRTVPFSEEIPTLGRGVFFKRASASISRVPSSICGTWAEYARKNKLLAWSIPDFCLAACSWNQHLHQTWIQYVATSTLFGCFSLTNQSKNTSGCCCCYC